MSITLFDSHCHLDFPELAVDLEHHIDEARRVGVRRWFVPGCRMDTWERLRRLRLRLEPPAAVLIGAGQHPYYACEVHNLDELGARLTWQASQGHLHAIGECGLDKVRGGDAAWQQRVLETQLRVAIENDLPVVLHQVGLREQFLDALKNVGVPEGRGVVHGFGGDPAWARGLVQRGFFLGLGPALTKKSRSRLREAARVAPLESLVLETDAPDQSLAGGDDRPGAPSDLAVVCAELAELRGVAPSLIARQTFENAEKLFGRARGDGHCPGARPPLDPE